MCRNLIMIIHRYILLFYICDNNYIYIYVCVCDCVCISYNYFKKVCVYRIKT